ncbi:MAG: hypothetical protein PHG64_14435 [Paludibacter sp.]|nr:hypothetical protein [Paludibacter sp.]
MEKAELPVDYYIIDGNTGEIANEVYKGDRLNISRKKQISYYQKNVEEIEKDKLYTFGQDKKYSLLSEYSARQLADEKLTSTEYRVLLLMISNTNYKSGLIAFDNNKVITKSWVAKTLNISSRTADTAIKTLVDSGIIAENNTNFKTKYFFNPFIQYKGRWINKTLYEMFKNTKWAKRDS